MEQSYLVLFQILAVLLTGWIGYIAGRSKNFREAKHKAYSESLPSLLKVGYGGQEYRTNDEEKSFNKALVLLWLYGSKKVARKMDHATAILVKPERGVFTMAMQEVITEMRTDIQVSPFQKLKRHEIKHLYVKLVNTQTDASNASKE